jgi:hypothetical protein
MSNLIEMFASSLAWAKHSVMEGFTPLILRQALIRIYHGGVTLPLFDGSVEDEFG